MSLVSLLVQEVHKTRLTLLFGCSRSVASSGIITDYKSIRLVVSLFSLPTTQSSSCAARSLPTTQSSFPLFDRVLQNNLLPYGSHTRYLVAGGMTKPYSWACADRTLTRSVQQPPESQLTTPSLREK
ncbi:MAG: hypothetical protein DSM106950_26605 [Stigonema ocellatum SAG 48.90 = DSM 106950]|nr:hypothetical protein [Stigonema ocellatum SAG 48.90 = DSM 106950]